MYAGVGRMIGDPGRVKYWIVAENAAITSGIGRMRQAGTSQP